MTGRNLYIPKKFMATPLMAVLINETYRSGYISVQTGALALRVSQLSFRLYRFAMNCYLPQRPQTVSDGKGLLGSETYCFRNPQTFFLPFLLLLCSGVARIWCEEEYETSRCRGAGNELTRGSDREIVAEPRSNTMFSAFLSMSDRTSLIGEFVSFQSDCFY